VVGLVAAEYTQLSCALAAPPPPGWRPGQGRPRRWLRRLALMLLLSLPFDLVLLAVFAVLALTVAVVAGAVLLVAGAGYGVYRYLDRHAIAERAAREREATAKVAHRYRHALTYWHQLHYCYRCQGVFLPGHPWQHVEITPPGTLQPAAGAWGLAQRLADYADRVHGREVHMGG